ncbi:MAG: hypothetical protein L6R40_006444 [Gallowayella cf. fulva]|nr:MAG: hypothetical protein L6R40_006444 [Xanthomendoza cf. fulva]
MKLPSLLTLFTLISASSQLNPPLPVSAPPSSIAGAANAIAGPSPKWPAVPWKLTGLLNGGTAEFNAYGRRLSFNDDKIRQVNEGAGRIFQALRHTFYPQSQPVEFWPYSRGVVHLWIELVPKTPATREEILDLFDWMLALMRRFPNAPREIKSAALRNSDGTTTARFSLTFPGIPRN